MTANPLKTLALSLISSLLSFQPSFSLPTPTEVPKLDPRWNLVNLNSQFKQAELGELQRADPRVSLMGPQGYSPIGFVLFIVSVVYIAIILICIIKRFVKASRATAVDDQQHLLINNSDLMEGQGSLEEVVEENVSGNYEAPSLQEEGRPSEQGRA